MSLARFFFIKVNPNQKYFHQILKYDNSTIEKKRYPKEKEKKKNRNWKKRKRKFFFSFLSFSFDFLSISHLKRSVSFRSYCKNVFDFFLFNK
jgi:hypothetical protein